MKIDKRYMVSICYFGDEEWIKIYECKSVRLIHFLKWDVQQFCQWYQRFFDDGYQYKKDYVSLKNLNGEEIWDTYKAMTNGWLVSSPKCNVYPMFLKRECVEDLVTEYFVYKEKLLNGKCYWGFPNISDCDYCNGKYIERK